MYFETFCFYWLFDSSEGKKVLHNSILEFDFEYVMSILRQYSKKNYRKIPKSSKIYIKCHILNCLGFNNYWILLHKINFHWRISMSVNIFPLEVFDFGVSLSGIIYTTCTACVGLPAYSSRYIAHSCLQDVLNAMNCTPHKICIFWNLMTYRKC